MHTTAVPVDMTTTQVTGITLQLGPSPGTGALVVHLTMTIPLLDIIEVIPDDFEQRETSHHELGDPIDGSGFWLQASAVPRAAFRTPTNAEWCLGRTAVQITPGQCTISMGSAANEPSIAFCQGFHIHAAQLASVILRAHAGRSIAENAPDHASVQRHAERRWDCQSPPGSPETLLRRSMMPEGPVAKQVRFLDPVDSSVGRASDDHEGMSTRVYHEDAPDNPAPHFSRDDDFWYGEDCKSQ